jgi:cysteine desulfurase
LEHRAVLDVLDGHVRHGRATVAWIPVDLGGQIDLSALEALLAGPADLVCVMAANNEIGTLYPLDVVGRLAADADVPLLVDATQAVGKVPVRVREWGISYLAMSAHKIYGPKGCGALIGNAATAAAALTAPGTPNVPGIVGLGEACRLRRLEMAADERRIADQRDRLEHMLRDRIPELIVNGDPNARLAGNLHVAIPDVPADAVVARLGDRLAISTGAACSAGAERSSHVLEAIGLTPELSDGALRFGLGKFTTDEELDIAAELTADAVAAIRAVMAGS